MFEAFQNNPNVQVIPLILTTTFLAVAGQLCLKHGMTRLGEMKSAARLVQNIPELFKSVWVLIGLIAYIVSTLIWMVVLKLADLSFAYPFISLSYVFVIIASRIVFRENIDFYKIIAILFIISGVLVLSMSPPGEMI